MNFSLRRKNEYPVGPEVPCFTEIRDFIIQQIEILGFVVDTQAEKSKCNCIIRVFQDIDYDYGDSLITFYGASCFAPRAGQWVSHGLNGKEFKIDHNNCVWRSWIFQDEYIDFECEFEDFYIKVEKK